VAAVVLACCSAALFGAMTVALRLALQRNPDASAGALACTAVAAAVALVAAGIEIATGTSLRLRELGVFALAGLVAPGASQFLFTRATREAGASRTSVVVGGAPLISVAIAIVLLGEPVHAPLLAGAILIVLGGIALVGERIKPEGFRRIGLLFAFVATILFSSRDNLVRWYSGDARTGSVAAAAVALCAGTLATSSVLAFRRGRRTPAALRPDRVRPFVPAGILFGLSYVSLFEAYYRGRVSVVSPLVATESLWGVALAGIVLGRSELVGRRLVAGALLIVAGGIVIGIFR
jgi:drug/metabolite transporter (DMT)-like permease